MNNSLSKYLKIYIAIISIITIFVTLFVSLISKSESIIITEPKEFYWPLPNNHIITSPFGPRKAPTSGASSYHSGMDIGAPAGTKIHSICDGYVSFIGFNGAGGFTITIKANPYKVSYCHVNPNFIVDINQYVSKGEIIGAVGPKYVDYPSQYKDSNGYTNGATTGPHLHLTVRKNEELINPNLLFQ